MYHPNKILYRVFGGYKLGSDSEATHRLQKVSVQCLAGNEGVEKNMETTQNPDP